MKKVLYLVLGVLLAVALTIGGCAEKEEETLKMVLIPSGEAIKDIENYEPIVEYLGEQIGRPIELVVATDYTAAIISLKVGDADIARLGSFSYVLAVSETNVEPIVRGIKKSTGKDSYYSCIITRADSGIETLDDLKGKTFAFVDVASTSGYLIPMVILHDADIDAEEDLERIYFAGSHPAVIEAVARGNVDAGSTCDHRLADAIEAGVAEQDEIIVIAQKEVAFAPTVVRSDLGEELTKKIQDAYLNMPLELCDRATGTLIGYVKAVDSDYDYAREAAKVLGLDLTKMK